MHKVHNSHTSSGSLNWSVFINYKVQALRGNRLVTIWLVWRPVVLGSLPMAHKRQSTSSMVLISSSPLFFSGSLVVSVTSRPPADLLTDLTCVFFHKSIPEFSISFVQFALIKLSKVLNTCVHRRRMRREMMCDLSKININIIQINK